MLVAEEEESTEGESSPSSFPPKPIKGGSNRYDVFLSFNSSDTRKEFTDALYHRLEDAGLHVFRSCNSIRIDEEFTQVVLDAITSSKISIPIISRHYALSKWCLRDLIHIMDCKKNKSHTVLPIFYKVDPLDVQHLERSFGEAFHSHKHHFDEKDIKEGQQALEDVTILHNWKFDESDIRDEGAFIEYVFQYVTRIREGFLLPLPSNIVGLDGQLRNIMNHIDTPSVNARMIGIYGIGGIGKTVLARCIYNKLSYTFDHVGYLQDIGEMTKAYGIKSLQRKLIYNILEDENTLSIDDSEINNIIKSRFTEKKVLILLDDIDHKDQLDALVGEDYWFASGSIIIVTTRNKAILDQSEFEVDYKHEMSEMDEVHSMILFSTCAFQMEHPPSDFVGISRQIISTTGGLPLALEVIGYHLYKKTDREIWDAWLEYLKKDIHVTVLCVLQRIYGALEDEHKENFLDIACSFIGKKNKVPTYMSDDYGFHASQGIEELKLRSLAKIEDDGKLSMHDQLIGLGKSIICRGQAPGNYSRLWVDEETFRVLTEKKETTMIEAICHIEYSGHPFLDYGPADHSRAYINEQFKKFQRLRFIRLRNSTSSEDYGKLFSEVRWLQWFHTESNLSFWATNLHLPKLVVLQLSYSLITKDWKEDWKGWTSIMTAKQLKVLQLEGFKSLRCTPDLSVFLELKILILRDCHGLKQVHHSIGKVKSLVCLDLSCCSTLEKLPGEVGELEELKELILDSSGIIEIPTSIGSLRKLEKLSACSCKSLREVPCSVGELQNLEHMDMSGSAIERFPCAIGRLKKLRILSLKSCHRLKWEIPREIGDLSSLEILEITEALKIDMPKSIQNLSSLQHLNLWGCYNLPSLLDLPSSLKYLRASYQGSRSPELSHLIHLEELDLSWKRPT
ncbi:hypothetical protein ACJRO7_027397 [Eucalyptus globulus]|uniref:TIR domain-containing protein n=1 Tax=Eucalyptus globulus TaxID=34317 RepID=A0ABD3K1B6_EUCGL